jgi:hypothetical protein
MVHCYISCKIEGFQAMKAIKTLAVLVFVFSLIHVISPAEAIADVTNRVFSPTDTSNLAQVNPNFDLVSVETGLDSSDSNILYIWLHFKNKITSRQFVGNKPWAAVLIYREQPITLGGNTDDIRIQTSSTLAYSGLSSISTFAEGNHFAGEARNSLASCNPKTWTNVDQGVDWIGFSIDRTCADIPSQFWITGYVDPDQTNSSTYPDYDYAPNTASLVDYSSQWDDNSVNLNDPMNGDLLDQVISINAPSSIALSKKSVWINASSDSGLALYFESNSPKVCLPSGNLGVFKLLSAGMCTFTAYQDGDDSYNPAQEDGAFLVTVPAVLKKSTAAPKSSPSKAPVKTSIAPPIPPKK